MSDTDKTTDSPALEQLRALGRGVVGRTVSDDEWITAVCEGAIEEIERLLTRVEQLEATQGRPRGHDEWESLGRNAWAHGATCDPSSFTKDPGMQHAFRRGWMAAENEQRRARGEPEVPHVW